jgi:MYXO-CTERM domain-containing protein
MLSRTLVLSSTLVAIPAAASPRAFTHACTGPAGRCHALVATDATGRPATSGTPIGYGADDLASAYAIPAAQQAATIAIVDAYGYPTLASDLAAYRAYYHLPACTVASGCLRILNQHGETSPLPVSSAGGSDDWTFETALDVDMASAGCPTCKIVVVQTDDDSSNLLYGAQEAGVLHPTVISNSWGFLEADLSPLASAETIFQAAASGIAVFSSAGDAGYDTGGMGAWYPSTSAYVIAVGGTTLSKATNPRGWSEVAWNLGGSSCSTAIAPLASASSAAKAACRFRASADLAAVGGIDPGVAVYNNGAWVTQAGTSVATPLVAAMFAGAGLGAATPDTIPQLTSALVDVTAGSNGACSGPLCNAGVGWDGPTGYGTPNATALPAAAATGVGSAETLAAIAPQNGDTVAPGFAIELAVTGPLTVAVALDGNPLGSASAAPFTFQTPADIALGAHAYVAVGTDPSGASGTLTVDFTVAADGGGSGGGDGGGGGNGEDGGVVGGCAAGGTGTGTGAAGCVALIALAAFAGVRRRRDHGAATCAMRAARAASRG